MSLTEAIEQDQTKAYVLKGDHFHKLVARAFRREKGRFFVYSWFRHGECLYVGCSRNLAKRFRSHDALTGQDQVQPDDVIFVEPCDDWIDATTLERCLIKMIRPVYNRSHLKGSQRAKDIFEPVYRELRRLNEIAKAVYPDGAYVA